MGGSLNFGMGAVIKFPFSRESSLESKKVCLGLWTIYPLRKWLQEGSSGRRMIARILALLGGYMFLFDWYCKSWKRRKCLFERWQSQMFLMGVQAILITFNLILWLLVDELLKDVWRQSSNRIINWAPKFLYCSMVIAPVEFDDLCILRMGCH